MKKLEGLLTISRPQGSQQGEVISIEVKDERAGCRVVRVTIGLAEFAECLTGHAFVKCALEVDDTGRVGKIRENKTEIIPPLGNTYSRDEDLITEALAPFEVDGWTADRSDMTNGHRSTPRGQSVGFIRYVDPPKEQA